MAFPRSMWNTFSEADDATNFGINPSSSSYPVGVGFTNPNLNISQPTQGLNWFGNSSVIGGISGGLQALSGLANAYVGYQNYKLADKQFGFQKALANRNLQNQGKLINNAINTSAKNASIMDVNIDRNTGIGMQNVGAAERAKERAKERYVDVSKI